jgi:hypothetical protein
MQDIITEIISSKLGKTSIVIFSVSVASFVAYQLGVGVGTLIYRYFINK